MVAGSVLESCTCLNACASPPAGQADVSSSISKHRVAEGLLPSHRFGERGRGEGLRFQSVWLAEFHVARGQGAWNPGAHSHRAGVTGTGFWQNHVASVRPQCCGANERNSFSRLGLQIPVHGTCGRHMGRNCQCCVDPIGDSARRAGRK
jgi:hypothetical protein